jgi:hypothetical protein
MLIAIPLDSGEKIRRLRRSASNFGQGREKGMALEALILVAVQNTDRRSRLTADYRRPPWIHGSSGNE